MTDLSGQDPNASTGIVAPTAGVMPSMGTMDPAYMAAMNRQTYAQALLNQGMSTTPKTTIFGALARGLQGYLGGQERDAAIQQLGAVGQRWRQEAMDFANQQQPQQPQAPVSGNVPPQLTPATINPTATPDVPPNLQPIIAAAAKKYGIPEKLLTAQYMQESQLGKASPNIGQVQQATWDNPGYGMNPGAKGMINDPASNIDFSAQYLAKMAEANGLKDWNDPNQAAKALASYNGGGDANYAEHVLGRTGDLYGGGPIQLADAQRGTSPQGQTPNGVPPGFAMAQALYRKAMIADMSFNPIIKAQAGILRQQASAYMNMGAWGPVVEVRPGVYAQQHGVTGEVKLQGRQTPPEQQATDLIDRVTYAQAHGLPQDPRDIAGYGTALATKGFGPKTEWDATQNKPRTIWPSLPAGAPDPGDLIKPQQPPAAATSTPQPPPAPPAAPTTGGPSPAPAAPPAAGSPGPAAAPGGPASGAPAVSGGPQGATVPAPGTPGSVSYGAGPGTASQQQIQSVQDAYKAQVDKDQAQAAEEYGAAVKGQPTYATTQAIRNLLPQIHAGMSADIRMEAARLMADAGGNPDAIMAITGTDAPAAELMRKLLGKQSLDQLRSLGAHEAASMGQYVASINPSLQSRPETIDEMTRVMDMMQRRNEDRANAQKAWLNQQVMNVATSTEPNIAKQIAGYKGLQGFDDAFDQTNDPRVYMAAALASTARGNGHPEIWGKGLTPQQQVQALQIARRMYPTQFPLK